MVNDTDAWLEDMNAAWTNAHRGGGCSPSMRWAATVPEPATFEWLGLALVNAAQAKFIGAPLSRSA